MQRSLLEPFYYSRNEKRGILIFLFIVLILFIYQLVIPTIYNPYKEVLIEVKKLANHQTTHPIRESLDTIVHRDKNLHAENKFIVTKPVSSDKKIEKSKSTPKLFDFDPNSISKDSLALLGLSTYVSTNWSKFRQAGGKFYKADHILKIYGLDSSSYLKLLPFVKIKSDKPRTSKNKKAEKYFKQILLNQTGSEELQSLNGIGPVLSERIVKFRDALGGYYKVDQVREVYGITDSLFTTIKSQLKIDSVHICMDINELNEEQFAKHPYIKWKQAKLIVRFRNQHGPFQGLTQLYQIKAFDSSYVKKISPYLKL
jgi:competence ComEA-like helix-hairpin-helix protein